MSRIPEDTFFILMSDHGMGSAFKDININKYLIDLGLLKLTNKKKNNALNIRKKIFAREILFTKLQNCELARSILERKISGVQKFFQKIADDLDVLRQELNQTGESTTDQTWHYKDSWKNTDQTDTKE